MCSFISYLTTRDKDFNEYFKVKITFSFPEKIFLKCFVFNDLFYDQLFCKLGIVPLVIFVSVATTTGVIITNSNGGTGSGSALTDLIVVIDKFWFPFLNSSKREYRFTNSDYRFALRISGVSTEVRSLDTLIYEWSSTNSDWLRNE